MVGDQVRPAAKGFAAGRQIKQLNEVLIDGSGRWVKVADMRYIHSWSPGSRELYFYQDNLDQVFGTRVANLKSIH